MKTINKTKKLLSFSKVNSPKKLPPELRVRFKKFCLSYDPFTDHISEQEQILLQKLKINIHELGPFEQTRVLLNKLQEIEHAP